MRTPANAASALARASRLAHARGSSPRFGISSSSAGRSASGSMPAWLISARRRRGEPEASTNLGRPIIDPASVATALPRAHSVPTESERALDSFVWRIFLSANRCPLRRNMRYRDRARNLAEGAHDDNVKPQVAMPRAQAEHPVLLLRLDDGGYWIARLRAGDDAAVVFAPAPLHSFPRGWKPNRSLMPAISLPRPAR